MLYIRTVGMNYNKINYSLKFYTSNVFSETVEKYWANNKAVQYK